MMASLPSRGRSALLSAGLFAALLSPAALAADTPLEARVNEALALADSEVFDLDVEGVAGQSLRVQVPMMGSLFTLVLEPHSVRSPTNYQVLVQGADGELRPVAPGPVQTLRGSVEGIPGSRVAASYDTDGKFSARIRITEHLDEFWVDQVGDRVQDVEPIVHVVYRTQDVLDDGTACGVKTVALPKTEVLSIVGPACGVGMCVAELGCDSDAEYYDANGSSVAGVENKINSIINAMNMQYEDEVQIRHEITNLIVRPSNPDPYSGDMGDLLNQLRGVWQGSGMPHDTAQLFSGRDTSGNVIGLAWLSGVCGNLRYSVVEQFSGNFSCLTDLSAHELGHNWGSPHCTCPGNTMNPSITCANTFSAGTRNTICNFAASLNCLQGDGPPTAAISADKETGSAPLNVRFTNTSGGAYTDSSWDFGDGNTSTEENPSNTYASPGTYTVSLTVSGPAGSDSITVTDYITVTEEVIDFTDLGGGTFGFVAVPTLTASSTLLPGDPIDVDLIQAHPAKPCLAWLSFTSVPVNAIGGTIHANPPANQFQFFSNVAGMLSVSTTWPAGVPSGTELYLQFIVQDPTVPPGLTLSNGIMATVP